jgi:hypothetical protein
MYSTNQQALKRKSTVTTVAGNALASKYISARGQQADNRSVNNLDTLSLREKSLTNRSGAADILSQSILSNVRSRIYDHLMPPPEITAEGKNFV